MAEYDRKVAVRVPGEAYEAAERIAASISRGGPRTTTSEVLRMALRHGLKVLVRKYGRKR